MKKITTLIAITLLAALLFTGCGIIPLKQDFSQYGFTFTIAGDVTEIEGNEAGSATLITKYGKMTFTRHTVLLPIINITLAEQIVSGGAKSSDTLENGAKFYAYAAAEGDAGMVIETHYFIVAADGSTWQISCVTPEDDYNKDALTKVYTSVEFVPVQE